MITVDDVSVSFDDVSVLDNVSVAAESGEFVGLVGPNGSGKTTLLRTISGALTPDCGRVCVDGEDIHTLPSRVGSQRVAVVPQDTSISFSFDVRRIVGMGRTAHRGRFESMTVEDRTAIENALERTDTTQFADRSIDAISGGERQRVLLARAIAQATPALLLDEPTASLDVNHGIETLQLVRSLVDDGTAAIAAIHDLDLAARYCDSLVMLSDGDVVATGPPESVLTESTVSSTFDVRAAVTPDPVTGAETVRALEESDPPRGVRIHVLGAGNIAARTLVELDRAGFDLSIGPIPNGDIAVSTAHSLGADTVTSTPLSGPTDEQLSTAREQARTADVSVLVDETADPDVGRLVLDAATPLVVVESGSAEPPISDRDADAWVASTDAVVDSVSDAFADEKRVDGTGDGRPSDDVTTDRRFTDDETADRSPPGNHPSNHYR
nr:ATP-binding cassette domain-containing protein [Natranaeroarchaeum aerophilus]